MPENSQTNDELWNYIGICCYWPSLTVMDSDYRKIIQLPLFDCHLFWAGIFDYTRFGDVTISLLVQGHSFFLCSNTYKLRCRFAFHYELNTLHISFFLSFHLFPSYFPSNFLSTSCVFVCVLVCFVCLWPWCAINNFVISYTPSFYGHEHLSVVTCQ